MHRKLASWAVAAIAALAVANFAPANEPAPTTVRAASSFRVAWRQALTKSVDTRITADATLAVVGDSEGNLIAINPADGKRLWSRKLSTAITSAATLTSDVILVGDDGGHLNCLARADGQTKWSIETDGKIVGQPTVTGDLVLFGSYDQHVYAVDLSTGKQRWRFATDAQVHAPVIANGQLALTAGCDGKLRALTTADGQQRFATDLGEPSAASPVVVDQHAIAATLAGTVFAADADGKIAWREQCVSETQVMLTPALAPGWLAVAAENSELLILDPASGRTLAKTRIIGGIESMLVWDSHLLIGTGDGKVLTIAPPSVDVVRQLTLGGQIKGLARSGNALLANTAQGVVWGLLPR